MRKYRLIAAAVAVVALFATAAGALDIADVKNLVKNNVDETVIVNMVRQGGALSATAGDVVELRSMGASETLIAAIGAAAPATSAPAPATTYQGPGEYILQDGTTAAIPQSTPTYADPNVVYYEAPTVVTSPPTVYYEAPTVYYGTPTYVYPYSSYPHYRSSPSFSFSFGFGGRSGRYHGGRRHGGGWHGRPPHRGGRW